MIIVAKLYFRYGAMNCGKSAVLMQVAHNYEERGMKVLVMKSIQDKKGNDYLVSRIGLKRKIDYFIREEDDVFSLYQDKCQGVSCILIDEAQFLSMKQVDELMRLVIKCNVPIMCYGLRTDFKTNGFPGSTRLLEIAHSIEEIKTICSCGRKAMFNTRKVNGKWTFDGAQVAIDGMDEVSYESLCPKCYYEKKEKWDNFKKSVKCFEKDC